MTQLDRFQHRINEAIPLTRSLGVRLERYDGKRLLVTAPLALNSNHQGTGFGGSLYAVAVVAAWGAVELLLADSGLTGNVVVQTGGMDYLGPVEEDFFAVSELPPATELARFQKSLARHGKGRLNIEARLYCGAPGLSPEHSQALAVFQGRFVVDGAHRCSAAVVDRQP
ncbi:YiiD C-terminal domain-containing protein [Marinobacter sp. SS21]|uniref:YiiD C-terminal domain-containing protein n=1 Tax=Marinobacter sp. SS21 TaxID=2979460 RepID=UPI00232DC4C6|nr:YiiD C-terminal domain-containing protein [Marinobacter sp. SS21]MDC0663265.1 YiiD C-terminal domain-containing protein [Marinobacter sp. SS21]